MQCGKSKEYSYALHLIQVINYTYEWKPLQELLFDEVLIQSNVTQNQIHSNENVQNKENTILLTTENNSSKMSNSKTQKVLVSLENNSQEVKKYILNIFT